MAEGLQFLDSDVAQRSGERLRLGMRKDVQYLHLQHSSDEVP